MNDEEYRGMVLQHDKHLDTLTSSITVLADNVGTTNRKLDDVIDVINTQNVIVERMNNLDINLKESFSRVHEKVHTIEHAQNTEGCSVLKVQEQKVSSLGRSVDMVRTRVDNAEKSLLDMVSGTVIRWGIAILIGYSIIFGTYVVKSLHALDKLAVEKIQMQRGINNEVSNVLARHGLRIDTNTATISGILPGHREQ